MKKIVSGIMLILLIMIGMTIMPSRAGTTRISVINPETGDNNFVFHILPTRFNVTVWVFDVTNLYGWEVRLFCDDTILSVTRAWIPTWDNRWIFFGLATVATAPTLYDSDCDGSNEVACVGDALRSVGSGVNGTGLLAVIEFQILHGKPPKTSSFLSIDNVDTKLLNSSLNCPSTLKVDGYLEYIWPDLNGDGKVDIKDISIVALAFGSYPSHPRWNPIADVYQDSKIDIRDIALIAKNFGKIDP
jgi:hypothetical protein